MKRPDDTRSASVHDYGAALESAVSWLGDRYLLATPQARRNDIRPIYVLEAKQPPARRAARRVSH